jgi:hypothetical protein
LNLKKSSILIGHQKLFLSMVQEKEEEEEEEEEDIRAVAYYT